MRPQSATKLHPAAASARDMGPSDWRRTGRHGAIRVPGDYRRRVKRADSHAGGQGGGGGSAGSAGRKSRSNARKMVLEKG